MPHHLRECIATLQHHLNCLDPHRNVESLSLILQLFTSVDVTSHSTVADWLTPAFGWSISRKMVHSAMRKIPCPIKILVSSDGRPFLTCYSMMGESISDASKSSDYMLVPFTSEDGTCEGVTSASIHEGDLVRLRCLSSVIWVVFAILQKENKIILAVNNRDQSIATPKLGSSGILSEEKRSFYSSDFLGAVVWKEIIGDKLSDHSEECSPEISTDGLNIPEDLSNSTSSKSCVFQMPFTPWNTVLQSMLVLVKEENLHSKDLSMKVKASMYKSSSSSKFSVKKSGHSDSLSASTSTSPLLMIREKRASTFIDNYETGGYHAQAQMWIRREEDIREARNLLWNSDPFSCCLSINRDRWILTCRALRSLCRGGDDLLDDFYRWTKMAGVEGMERSKSCRSVWTSLRPLTTCDLPCVVQARVYARAHAHFNHQEEGVYEGTSNDFNRLSNRSIETQCRVDPTFNSFMSAASVALSDHSLHFLSSVHDQQQPAIGHHPAGAVFLPAAVYKASFPCTSSSDGLEGMKSCTFDDVMQVADQDEVGVAVDIVTPSKLVRTTETVACISPGNVLLLPIIPINCPDSWEVHASYERSPSSSYSSLSSTMSSRSRSTWHRVVSVDLFHARIRVSPCPPPPDCWTRHVTLPSVWAPISSLWGTTICQIIPNKSPEWSATIEYLIYISPLPSRVASLSALASLPRKDTGHAESSTLKSTARRRKIKSK